MNMQFAAKLAVDSFQSFEDFEAPVDAWSLDELDRLSDLESVRTAWARTDDQAN